MSELEQALWQAFDGSLAVSSVAKHVNHNQKDHGKWARGRRRSESPEDVIADINDLRATIRGDVDNVSLLPVHMGGEANLQLEAIGNLLTRAIRADVLDLALNGVVDQAAVASYTVERATVNEEGDLSFQLPVTDGSDPRMSTQALSKSEQSRHEDSSRPFRNMFPISDRPGASSALREFLDVVSEVQRYGNDSDGVVYAMTRARTQLDLRMTQAVKWSIVQRLTDRLVDTEATQGMSRTRVEEVTDKLNRAWAESSTNAVSMAMHEVAASLTDNQESYDGLYERVVRGTYGHRPRPGAAKVDFIGTALARIDAGQTSLLGSDFRGLTPSDTAESRAFVEAYAQAVYDETQSLLRGPLRNRLPRGDTTRVLSRGTDVILRNSGIPRRVAEMANTDEQANYWRIQDDTANRQPLSSWSSTYSVAEGFQGSGRFQWLGMVQSAKIPLEAIWSSALTGPGSLAEDEFVVIDPPGEATVKVPAKMNLQQDVIDTLPRDADGDGWLYEGTDQERFVGGSRSMSKAASAKAKQAEVWYALSNWIPPKTDKGYFPIDEPVTKHANHNQKDHGNWAKGRSRSEEVFDRDKYESLLLEAEWYKSERLRGDRLSRAGIPLTERIAGVKAKPVKLAATAASDSSWRGRDPLGLKFFGGESLTRISEAVAKITDLEDRLKAAGDIKIVPTAGDAAASAQAASLLEFIRLEMETTASLSEALAANVDLDLLTTPPPDGKMTSWADSVAANPDDGAGFMAAVRELVRDPKIHPAGRDVVTIVAGELISAHIRKATSEVSEVRLDSRISELDFTKPFADQQESPLPHEELNASLLSLLPLSTQESISKVMDEAVKTPLQSAERTVAGGWKDNLELSVVSGAFKHSVNGRIAERIYAASGDRTIVGIGLVDVYARVNSQTEAWAKSPVIEYSAQLQQSVSRMAGREDSFDSFAERQNLVGLLGTAFTDVYARAVYAETQALLALSPETSFKAARGTKLGVTDNDLPVKVIEAAIAARTFTGSPSHKEKLKESSWQVSTSKVGRQPLTSWSTSMEVARAFAGMYGSLSDRGDGVAVVQRAKIPDTQIFSTALTGPGCLNEAEVIALEGTSGTTSISAVMTGAVRAADMRSKQSGLPSDLLRYAQARDADGDGWIFEGTDREQFVGKADKKFEYNREVPEQSREGIVSLLTWIPDNWDAAYLIDEPSDE